jgi:hypothetical protein
MWPLVSRGEGRGKSAGLTATDEPDEEGVQEEGNLITEMLERYRGKPNEYRPLPGARAGPVLPGSPRMEEHGPAAGPGE